MPKAQLSEETPSLISSIIIANAILVISQIALIKAPSPVLQLTSFNHIYDETFNEKLISKSFEPQLTTEQQLIKSAPTINPIAIHNALEAESCASRKLHKPSDNLVVIDYSLPSTVRRMWTFDLVTKTLLQNDYVAHGKGSGEGINATKFSNEVDSGMSSLGLFRTGEKYLGTHGFALRLNGLEAGINDMAERRSIVLHSSLYVNKAHADNGYIGRSLGCPAVSEKAITPLVEKMKTGGWIYAYYPDKKMQKSSKFLSCKV